MPLKYINFYINFNFSLKLPHPGALVNMADSVYDEMENFIHVNVDDHLRSMYNAMQVNETIPNRYLLNFIPTTQKKNKEERTKKIK